jgi:hypothetical protein
MDENLHPAFGLKFIDSVNGKFELVFIPVLTETLPGQ